MEQPEFKWKLIDLDPQETFKKQLDSLKEEIYSGSPETYLAFRTNKRYTLCLTHQKKPDQQNPWKAPRAALVTGGLGALGFEVAFWLAKQGVQYLFLLGNTILPPRSEWTNIKDLRLKTKIEQILSLEAMGANVYYSGIDVSDRDGLVKEIEVTEAKWQLKIDGVFHLAGITTDSILIEDTSESLLASVFAPKVQGTLALHETFKERFLNCFVLFSSTSALPYFGINGLIAYAAANAFMDGFAYYRQSLGLPALSINWTSWAEKGMSFEHKQDSFFALLGLSTLPISEGLQFMNCLLTGNRSNAIILKADWHKFLQVNSRLKSLYYFSHLVPADLGDTSYTQTNYSYEGIFNLLLQALAKILIMQPEELEPDTPLRDYGLDSTNGLIFVSELAKVFPHNPILPTDLYRYTTITKLSEYIYQQQNISEQLLPLPAQPIHLNSKHKSEKEQLDEISQLTDQQAEAFLKAEIEEVNKLLNS